MVLIKDKAQNIVPVIVRTDLPPPSRLAIPHNWLSSIFFWSSDIWLVLFLIYVVDIQVVATFQKFTDEYFMEFFRFGRIE
ncbi:hypothetical protein SAMN05192553_102717 [Cyclobacterium xiamenense]|uniref:Uncharacterized protein n=1 Tax=Cyclobacterium xiamenense TaxID=1297121 RepID=A0A1H6WQQ8_9BACT|nr:hypothetical protein SAMN05192553_102717 [Cyclobacterium xiamenense]